MQWQIREFLPETDAWEAYVTHLRDMRSLYDATNQGEPEENSCYLGALMDSELIGHIAIQVLPLTVPASNINDNTPTVLEDAAGNPLQEAFVMSFAVHTAHRRQGIGRALQIAAYEKARDLHCYQIRSWSTAEKKENYALKLSLGYVVQPMLYPLPGISPISGVYFIKPIM